MQKNYFIVEKIQEIPKVSSSATLNTWAPTNSLNEAPNCTPKNLGAWMLNSPSSVIILS